MTNRAKRNLSRRWFARCVPAPLVCLAVSLAASLATDLSSPSSASGPPRAFGDELRLHHGGRVRGNWENSRQRPVKEYEIRTSTTRIVLDSADVASVRRSVLDERDYERFVDAQPDTVAGHWAIAQWCLQHRSKPLREAHLRRILDLEPDHGPARHALGYYQLDGRWVTREKVQEEAGMVRYDGKWRSPQEVTLIERRRKQEIAERNWTQKLIRWRHQLEGDAQEAGRAREELARVKAPEAVAGLQQLLARETVLPLAEFYARILGQIGTPAARRLLITTSLSHPSEDVFDTCLNQLRSHPLPESVDAYVQHLRSPRNSVVNRAAIALRLLEARSTVESLITALVTEHIVARRAAGPQYQETFVRSEDGAAGTAPPVSRIADQGGELTAKIQNREVLKTLVHFGNGESFGYDQRLWRAWWNSQKNQSGAANRIR